ncbi:hypothetical protein [Cardinium endosymbiont of Oedothorax gibbosus]|uniref:hypothetical protein n=1 Tax=Cardinium endosymbiont of Oedothorax gibbosus TaxID=931101 RepID=UPI00202594F5|nr:hypothetical protein [Cardinium endosymbiont of Oedothorax gibbosus]
MASLEDNQEDRRIIECFEKRLMQLLEAYAAYQKQIIQLTEENQTLKSLLEASKTNLSSSTAENHKALPFDNHLVNQINKYIKEIDLCLAYFEQA